MTVFGSAGSNGTQASGLVIGLNTTASNGISTRLKHDNFELILGTSSRHSMTVLGSAGSNRTAASGLLTGLNTTALNGTSSISSLAGSGQLTDGQEVNMDADLELAYTGMHFHSR